MSPMVDALVMMVRYCWRVVLRASMRAWRSTYCPVTSVALVVRLDVLPSASACVSTPAKPVTGTWRVIVPEGGPPEPLPVCVCELATKPPAPVAMADNLVIVLLSAPRCTVRPSEPVCSILADWPTAPVGSDAGPGTVVEGTVRLGCPAVDLAAPAAAFSGWAVGACVTPKLGGTVVDDGDPV